MKHGRPHGGEEENVGAAPPLKNHENKIFAIYSSLWGAFSLCEGLFRYLGRFCYFFQVQPELIMGGLFHDVGAFFTMWGPFSRCGGLFAIFFSL